MGVVLSWRRNYPACGLKIWFGKLASPEDPPVTGCRHSGASKKKAKTGQAGAEEAAVQGKGLGGCMSHVGR